MRDHSYLLCIRELLWQEALARRAEKWLDDTRRRQAACRKTAAARAASVGAGLLLQKAVADYQRAAGVGDSGARGRLLQQPEASSQAAYSLAPGHCPVQHLSVSQLLWELEAGQLEPFPLSYTYGPCGKPYLEGIPLFFSLSHSGEYVLCAVSEKDIGADIQKMQPVDYGKLAGRFYAREECSLLEQCATNEEGQVLFYRLWARKESLGKLTGQGVAGVLDKPVWPEGAWERQVAAYGARAEGKPDEGGPEGIYIWQDLPCPLGYQAAICRQTGL